MTEATAPAPTPTPAPTAAPTPIPIVLDCDPGHDDAIALLLALGSPALDLRAVTTVFGNCSLADATRNALAVLTLAGAVDVPVGAGAAGPLAGDATLGNYVHGASGLDGPALPPPAFATDPRGAVPVLLDALASSPAPVSIVATGPLTNIAVLLRDHPEARQHIREVVFMGGSTERGNHTPYAEFNTFADPEALEVLLGSGLPVTMVGLNLTHQARATPEVVRRIRAVPGAIGTVAAAWLGFFTDAYARVWDFSAPPVHDPCTLFALIEPESVEVVERFVAVETTGVHTRGATAVDLFHRWPDPPNARVAVRLDTDRYWDTVIAAISALAPLATDPPLDLPIDPPADPLNRTSLRRSAP